MRMVLERAERQVTPSAAAEKKIRRIADLARRLVEAEAAGRAGISGVEFGGSYPKGTWLPGGTDIDIFVRFKADTPEKKFAEISQKVGFAALEKFGPYTRFSEHPYVEAVIEGVRVNIVPCYDVPKGKWKSSADRTQFHTRFMLENLSERMRLDVRLLKQFLKNNGMYGAEISQQGFSGYAAEVLVWNFGSFEGVVRGMAGIKPGQVIGEAAKEFGTQVVIMDPVDPKRNLAAAISAESLGRLVLSCRGFLKKPSSSYFKGSKKKSPAILLENCIAVSFRYRPRSPDIIWGQVKSAAGALAIQLEFGGFVVVRSLAHADGKGAAHLFFLLESARISAHRTREGPEFFGEDDARQFVSKNAGRSLSMWVGENGRIMSLERRAEGDARRFLSRLLAGGLDRSGVPGGIKRDIRDGFRVVAAPRLNVQVKARLREMISTDAAVFSSS